MQLCRPLKETAANVSVWLTLFVLGACGPQLELATVEQGHTVTCPANPSLTNVEPALGWTGDVEGWLGVGSSQISSAAKVVSVAVDLPPQKYFRLERNFLCNRPGNVADLKAVDSWGGDMLSVNGTTLRNIRIGLAAASKPPLLRPWLSMPAPSVTFRLWDRKGGWLEWPLVGKPGTFDLSVAAADGRIDLTALGGFVVEVKNESKSGAKTSLSLSELKFETSAKTGALAPTNKVIPVPTPLTNVAASGALHDFAPAKIHTIINVDTVTKFFTGNTKCESAAYTAQECTESVVDFVAASGADLRAGCVQVPGSTSAPVTDATCDAAAAKEATKVLEFVVGRVCPKPINGSYADCGFEFEIGPDNEELTITNARLKSRLEKVAAFCDTHGIPFYIKIAGPGRFSVSDWTVLEGAIDRNFARGLWVGETEVENRTALPTAIATLVDFMGKLRDKGKNQKLGFHRFTNAWWNFSLHAINLEPLFAPEFRDVLVPLWENIEPGTLGLAQAAVLGFKASGRSADIGVSVQSWGWDNIRWSGSDAMAAHIFSRMLVSAVASGATYVQIEPSWYVGTRCTLPDETAKPGVPVCSASVMAARNALEMYRQLVENGTLLAAKRLEDMVTLPKIVLQSEYGDLQTQLNAAATGFAGLDEEPAALFNVPNLNNYTRSLPKPPSDVFALLYGSSLFYEELFPVAKYGQVAVLPPVGLNGWGSAPAGYQTIFVDGVRAREPNKTFGETTGKPIDLIRSHYAQQALSLPFAASKGSMSAVRTGPDHYLVYLIDNEHRFGIGATSHLTIRLPGDWTATDALTGVVLPQADKVATVSVPAGGFSLVRVWKAAGTGADLVTFGAVGTADIAVARLQASGALEVTARAAGAFPAYSREVGAKVLQGDFDGDGITDFGITGPAGWEALPIAFGRKGASFALTNTWNPQFQSYGSMTGAVPLVADFNGDGKSDIAITGSSDWTNLPVAFSRGDGGFDLKNEWNKDFQIWASEVGAVPSVGDFNADGKADIAITGPTGWSKLPIAFSVGDGAFTVTNFENALLQSWAAVPGAVPLVGDFNGDGRSDILLTGPSAWQKLPVGMSKGDGSFDVYNLVSPTFQERSGQKGSQRLVGDINGDGRSDIVVAGGVESKSIDVAFSNGDGSFKTTSDSQGAFASLANATTRLDRLADYDGDGRLDIAFSGGADPKSVSIAFSQGDGTFVLRTISTEFAARTEQAGSRTFVGRL